nr:MAG TPA: hypothetical protein [Caudoviricetes sp.]DAK87654.1 MAG TPA: hypothetical protein [Bacteriophage sp.]DAZ71816.1 MAG TPA: hypothetical protein [Caudoviricetes sp.]DAZ80789.1 MAG TPA: hypothetical protein [Caudoviricetes sp.]
MVSPLSCRIMYCSKLKLYKSYKLIIFYQFNNLHFLLFCRFLFQLYISLYLQKTDEL